MKELWTPWISGLRTGSFPNELDDSELALMRVSGNSVESYDFVKAASTGKTETLASHGKVTPPRRPHA